MYERILVPLDSSSLADTVLPYAEVMAGALKSRVTLLYVSESEETPYHRVHEFYLGKIAQLVKSHIKEHYPERKDVSIRIKSAVVKGKPAEEISDHVRENNISLVIMAGHGRVGVMRRPMVSIVRKVFHATGVPLLLIRAKPYLETGMPQLLNRILLPLDGLKSGEAALPYVKKLTRWLPAEVTLLQVVAPSRHVHTLGGLDHVQFTGDQIETMKDIAREYLENTRKKLAGTKATLQCEVRVGDPGAEITRLAEKTNSRLVVLATHRHSALRQWIWGSVPQKVLQTTDKPILLVKALD